MNKRLSAPKANGAEQARPEAVRLRFLIRFRTRTPPDRLNLDNAVEFVIRARNENPIDRASILTLPIVLPASR